jgi:hypothetical protein
MVPWLDYVITMPKLKIMMKVVLFCSEVILKIYENRTTFIMIFSLGIVMWKLGFRKEQECDEKCSYNTKPVTKFIFTS